MVWTASRTREFPHRGSKAGNFDVRMRTFIGLTPERATTIVIGLAYLCAGAILFYGALYPEGRWLALVAGAAWLTAHGVFHVVERANDTASFERFTRAAPGVLGPRLMGWCALAILIARQRISPAGLPTSLFLSAVEKLAPGDNAYVHALARELTKRSLTRWQHPDWRSIDGVPIWPGDCWTLARRVRPAR